eukprot:CAMPEP_0170500574 /NCGR_PEP_ID=MMETSP0208-20121228/35320_1 /TAXON_ID=197538 /ORGANISM="Strombidium inclinatum, Strain S3" /LENGTH=109 /DNA_ID=CAMNT_0010778677 /DNA_START=779 /DNA_END=1104 /DNA_ORIENTATION=+
MGLGHLHFARRRQGPVPLRAKLFLVQVASLEGGRAREEIPNSCFFYDLLGSRGCHSGVISDDLMTSAAQVLVPGVEAALGHGACDISDIHVVPLGNLVLEVLVVDVVSS